MATAKNKCTIVLTDRKWNYTFSVSEEYLDQFLNDYLDTIIANETETRVNEVKIVSRECGIVLYEGITKKLFSFLKNMLTLYENRK